MGGEPYWYFVSYEPDLQSALGRLRTREFEAGRYNPVIDFLDFKDPQFMSKAPGAKHASVEEAIEEADADGTRSILDIERVDDEPDFGVASPLPKDTLRELYGTEQPTREMILNNMDFLGDIDRGHCQYTLVYKDGKPTEIFFAGYSYD